MKLKRIRPVIDRRVWFKRCFTCSPEDGTKQSIWQNSSKNS